MGREAHVRCEKPWEGSRLWSVSSCQRGRPWRGLGAEAEKRGQGPPGLCRWVCLGEVMSLPEPVLPLPYAP